MKFKLKVYHSTKKNQLLTLSGRDEEDVKRQVLELGYHIIAIRPQIDGFSFSVRPSFSAALFSEELLTLLEAGLSLVETVDALGQKAKTPESQHVLSSLLTLLREGKTFSQALASIPEVFPILYVATIRTSERTGNLVEALRRYLAYHRQLNLVREKVVAASVYPLLLMAVGFLVVLFLLGYVVPRFSLVYEDLGRNLPWMSRVLMKWGQFISAYGWQMGAATLAIIACTAYLLFRSSVKTRLLKILWSLPVIGEKIRLYQLARFTRTLAMLVNGGIPFVGALEMVRGLLEQPSLQAGLSKAVSMVREGRAVSDAFANNGLATDVGVRLLVVGERSGELGQSLERIASLYDDEIARWVDWFTKLFEPLLMIGIGLVIGTIVVLMYLPIFELANSLQ